MFPAGDDKAGKGLPNKLFFRIGEVSRLVGVEPYVLRYWETEFPAIAPRKTGGSHRLYRRKDVELLLKIKDLLYEKRYTLEGARQALRSQKRPPVKVIEASPPPDLFSDSVIPDIRKGLSEILEILK